MIKQLFCALSFLTILPVSPGQVSEDDLLASCRFFPVAGWLLGAVFVALVFVAGHLGNVPLPLLVPLLVGLSAWLTRGLHLDGVADLCDGLGGSFEVERRLAIMKDSATGAFGVVGLVIVLLCKAAGLSVLLAESSLPWSQTMCLLALVPAMARWAMLTLAWGSRYPRQAGTGHFLVGRVGGEIVFPGLLFVLPVFWLVGWPALGVMGAMLLVVLVLRLKATSALGGITGDVLGAAIEWGEAIGWLTAAWLARGFY